MAAHSVESTDASKMSYPWAGTGAKRTCGRDSKHVFRMSRCLTGLGLTCNEFAKPSGEPKEVSGRQTTSDPCLEHVKLQLVCKTSRQAVALTEWGVAGSGITRFIY
jgi:hypothetical protein